MMVYLHSLDVKVYQIAVSGPPARCKRWSAERRRFLNNPSTRLLDKGASTPEYLPYYDKRCASRVHVQRRQDPIGESIKKQDALI